MSLWKFPRFTVKWLPKEIQRRIVNSSIRTIAYKISSKPNYIVPPFLNRKLKVEKEVFEWLFALLWRQVRRNNYTVAKHEATLVFSLLDLFSVYAPWTTFLVLVFLWVYNDPDMYKTLQKIDFFEFTYIAVGNTER